MHTPPGSWRVVWVPVGTYLTATCGYPLHLIHRPGDIPGPIYDRSLSCRIGRVRCRKDGGKIDSGRVATFPYDAPGGGNRVVSASINLLRTPSGERQPLRYRPPAGLSNAAGRIDPYPLGYRILAPLRRASVPNCRAALRFGYRPPRRSALRGFGAWGYFERGCTRGRFGRRYGRVGRVAGGVPDNG